jgi:hypothetical protein
VPPPYSSQRVIRARVAITDCCQIDAVRYTRSAYVLTLTTYADYIPDAEVENPLPEPVAAVAETNVVNLFG